MMEGRKNGRKGAAMLIALLVFLLAALSGTVVLTMATSNAGRYTHTKEDQQAYLAVMSAAQAVKSEFESGIETSIEYVYENKSLKKAGEASVSANGIFGSMVNNDIKMTLEYIAGNRGELTNYNEDHSYKPPEASDLKERYKYILRIGDSALSATMGDVAVELTINTTDAKLTFDFYYTGNGSDNYHVSMQVGNGSGTSSVISVSYPEQTANKVRISVQFHWNSDGATIQTVS